MIKLGFSGLYVTVMWIREGLAALWTFQLTVNHITLWIGHVNTWDTLLSDCDFHVYLRL